MYTLVYGIDEVCGTYEDCQRLAQTLRQTWTILDRFGVVMAACRGIL